MSSTKKALRAANAYPWQSFRCKRFACLSAFSLSHTYIHTFICIEHDKGPSIYHFRMDGVRLRWMHVVGGGGELQVDWTQKLEPTDIILSSSHAKKFFRWYKKFKFYVNIN